MAASDEVLIWQDYLGLLRVDYEKEQLLHTILSTEQSSAHAAALHGCMCGQSSPRAAAMGSAKRISGRITEGCVGSRSGKVQ